MQLLLDMQIHINISLPWLENEPQLAAWEAQMLTITPPTRVGNFSPGALFTGGSQQFLLSGRDEFLPLKAAKSDFMHKYWQELAKIHVFDKRIKRNLFYVKKFLIISFYFINAQYLHG